jgi:hypothetical protein
MSSRNALNLAELYALALNHGRDAFLAEVPYPVLVPRAVRIGNIERGQTADETMHYIPTVEDELSLFDSPRVLFLRRTAALGDGEEISIGRTADTDLVLSDHSVSSSTHSFIATKTRAGRSKTRPPRMEAGLRTFASSRASLSKSRARKSYGLAGFTCDFSLLKTSTKSSSKQKQRSHIPADG